MAQQGQQLTPEQYLDAVMHRRAQIMQIATQERVAQFNLSLPSKLGWFIRKDVIAWRKRWFDFEPGNASQNAQKHRENADAKIAVAKVKAVSGQANADAVMLTGAFFSSAEELRQRSVMQKIGDQILPGGSVIRKLRSQQAALLSKISKLETKVARLKEKIAGIRGKDGVLSGGQESRIERLKSELTGYENDLGAAKKELADLIQQTHKELVDNEYAADIKKHEEIGRKAQQNDKSLDSISKPGEVKTAPQGSVAAALEVQRQRRLASARVQAYQAAANPPQAEAEKVAEPSAKRGAEPAVEQAAEQAPAAEQAATPAVEQPAQPKAEAKPREMAEDDPRVQAYNARIQLIMARRAREQIREQQQAKLDQLEATYQHHLAQLTAKRDAHKKGSKEYKAVDKDIKQLNEEVEKARAEITGADDFTGVDQSIADAYARMAELEPEQTVDTALVTELVRQLPADASDEEIEEQLGKWRKRLAKDLQVAIAKRVEVEQQVEVERKAAVEAVQAKYPDVSQLSEEDLEQYKKELQRAQTTGMERLMAAHMAEREAFAHAQTLIPMPDLVAIAERTELQAQSDLRKATKLAPEAAAPVAVAVAATAEVDELDSAEIEPEAAADGATNEVEKGEPAPEAGLRQASRPESEPEAEPEPAAEAGPEPEVEVESEESQDKDGPGL